MARYRSRPLTHPNEAGNYCYQDAGTDSCRPIWLVVLHSLSRHVTFRSLTPTHVTSVTSPHTTWLHPGIYCLLLHRPKWTSAPHQTHHQTDPDWTRRTVRRPQVTSPEPAARDSSGQSQGGERRPDPGQTSPQAPRGRPGRPDRHVARPLSQHPPHSSGRWQHPPPPCCKLQRRQHTNTHASDGYLVLGGLGRTASSGSSVRLMVIDLVFDVLHSSWYVLRKLSRFRDRKLTLRWCGIVKDFLGLVDNEKEIRNFSSG